MLIIGARFGWPPVDYSPVFDWTLAAPPSPWRSRHLVRLGARRPARISRELLTDLHETGAVWAGAGLGAFATVGAVLTLGLVQRWDEVFPRRLPGVGGRRVPPLLAVVPATLVAIAVTAGSLGELAAPAFWHLCRMSSATAPMLLWPLWGPALGAATLAYHLRRRGACARCRRPWPGPIPTA